MNLLLVVIGALVVVWLFGVIARYQDLKSKGVWNHPFKADFKPTERVRWDYLRNELLHLSLIPLALVMGCINLLGLLVAIVVMPFGTVVGLFKTRNK